MDLERQSRTRDEIMETYRNVERRTLSKRKSMPIADCIVDGLLHGMTAGVVMLALFIGMGNLLGKEPLEVLAMLGAPDAASSPIQGALRHIAMSALYGIAWSPLIVLTVCHLQCPSATNWRLIGIGYGILLWMIALFVIQYWTALSLLPWYALLIAHMVYGGTLGYLQARQKSPNIVQA